MQFHALALMKGSRCCFALPFYLEELANHCFLDLSTLLSALRQGVTCQGFTLFAEEVALTEAALQESLQTLLSSVSRSGQEHRERVPFHRITTCATIRPEMITEETWCRFIFRINRCNFLRTRDGDESPTV